MKKLILVRGLPGSGKTTFAKSLSNYWIENDYFQVNEQGYYCYRADRLEECAAKCLQMVKSFIAASAETIVVSNVFASKKRMEPYMKLAERHGYQLVILTVESNRTDEELAKRNVTRTPVEEITRMRSKWESLL